MMLDKYLLSKLLILYDIGDLLRKIRFAKIMVVEPMF